MSKRPYSPSFDYVPGSIQPHSGPAPTVVNNITNNITINTLNAYFAPAPAPAVPVAQPVGPAPLFATNAERYHKVRRKSDKKMIYTSAACADGTLKAGCHHCDKRSYADISRFAPTADSTNSNGFRQEFDAAYAAYKVAHAAGDKEEAVKQRKIVEENRTERCDSCRESADSLSPDVQACKDEWDRMRKDACVRNGGCQNQDCPERGMASWRVLQADHGTNPKKLALSSYKDWALKRNGGVAGMREEAKQIAQWICGCCHALEPTSASGRRCPDPETMPDGKSKGTKEETKQYAAKHNARIRYPKQQHVDAKKREIGRCQYPGCGRRIVVGNEPSFHFDHRVESTKCKASKGDILFGKKGGVGGLVNNCSNAAALDKVEHLLDAEMVPKCDLLCVNCHVNRKPRGLGRWEVAE
jgi:hypothetical protein